MRRGFKKLASMLMVLVMVLSIVATTNTVETKASTSSSVSKSASLPTYIDDLGQPTVTVETWDEFMTMLYRVLNKQTGKEYTGINDLIIKYDATLNSRITKEVTGMNNGEGVIGYAGLSRRDLYEKYWDPTTFGQIGYNCSGGYVSFTKQMETDINAGPLTPAQLNYLLTSIKTACTEANLSGKSDYEVIKAITSWLSAEITYVDNGTMNPYEVLHAKKTACYGYASLTGFVLDAIGYPVEIAEGWEHCWNYVRLQDGKWYGLDTTWADLDKAGNPLDERYILNYVNDETEYHVDCEGMRPEDGWFCVPRATSKYTGTERTALRSWLIGIDSHNYTIEVGDSITLPKDQLTEFTVDDPSIIRINDDGTVTALKRGRANVSRKDANGEYVATEAILVIPNTTKLTVGSSKVKLSETQSSKIKVTNKTGEAVKYSTSNSSVATVSSSGKITAQHGGKCKVYVKAGQYSATINVTVLKPIINGDSSLKVKKGSRGLLYFSVDNRNGLKITYSSSNSKIATVSSVGYVTGKKRGTCYVYIKVGNTKKAVKIKVV